MFFCILNFYVEADCLKYALDILISLKPFGISSTYFPVFTPAISAVADMHNQNDPAQWISTPWVNLIKINDNWYLCLFAFDILCSSSPVKNTEQYIQKVRWYEEVLFGLELIILELSL